MQKKTFARLALASACALTALGAQAQASSAVNVYGLIDVSLSSIKARGATTRVTSVDNGNMTTSFWGISGTEDLGNGWSAGFKLEGFFRADTGQTGRFTIAGTDDAMFSRNAHVSVSSKSLGTLTLGRQAPALFVQSLLYNAFGDSFGYSPTIRHYYTSGTVTGDSGWNDAIGYSSPSFGGFRFGVASALGEDGTDGSNVGVNASYSSGPFSIAVAFQDVEKDGTTTNAASVVDDTESYQLAGSYDFGVAKVFAQYGQVDNQTTGNEYKISGIGARVPVGSGAFVAQYGKLNKKTGNDVDTLSVGYLHNLSKRTEVYATAMRDKEDTLSTGTHYSLGIRHKF
ncbi:porin [Macromonas nakdongensis]|uniref:porin n=1 Tax=Macromonas nakdongensis TaxID=1843082 RepID=UPI000C33A78C|nr:porin [Macromonas nakdongensis]